MRLAARVRGAIGRLGEARMLRILEAVERRARSEHLWYLHDGQPETIRLLPRPLIALPEQIGYVHSVAQTLHRALKHLLSLYFADPRVQSILQMPPAEEAWLRECWGERQRDANPVFGRLDAVVDFTTSHWKESLRFLEPNMGGIGGLHMIPTAEHILFEELAGPIGELDPQLELVRLPDVRDQLMQYVLDHLEQLGRSGRVLCFIEPKYAGEGPDEQSVLAEYLRTRYDIEVYHADPSELYCEGGEVKFSGHVIDIGYRDYEVRDLLELAAQGVDIAPMRQLLREDRMISSIAAELDQKSCWEIFTDPELASAHFSAEERQVFRRHVLWTRLVADRTTTLPGGGVGSLLEYAREARESLVLKPNRSYGGHGVTVGPAQSDADWQAALDRALADGERWVLQAVTPLPVQEFPIQTGDGLLLEPFYTVYGFCPTSYGVSVLGRASQKQVVNIAQRGGLFSLLLARSRDAAPR